MSTSDIQIQFLKEANAWLSKFENQKLYAIKDEDTNPKQKFKCIYVLGGWAVNRFYQYRKTSDIDVICNENQILKLLESFQLEKLYVPISQPDSTTVFTKKITLQDSNSHQFSLESRFFDLNDNIKFGSFNLNRDWLFKDSLNFGDRILGELAFVKVPSKIKLTVLKCISIVERKDDDPKIIADFIDVLTLSNEMDYWDIKKMISELDYLDFERKINVFNERKDLLDHEIVEKYSKQITDISLLEEISKFFPKRSRGEQSNELRIDNTINTIDATVEEADIDKKQDLLDKFLMDQFRTSRENMTKVIRLISELNLNMTFAKDEKTKINYEKQIKQNREYLESYASEFQNLKYIIEQGVEVKNKDQIIKNIDPYADVKINLKRYSKVPSEDLNFVGREDYIVDIWQRLINKENIGITGIGGMGGVGKSAIAIKICHLIRATWQKEVEFPEFLKEHMPRRKYFKDGILWIRFEKDEPLTILVEEKIEDQIAYSGFASLDIKNRVKSIKNVLSYYDILIVLDSAEQNVNNYKSIKKSFEDFPILITSRKDFGDVYTIDIQRMLEEEALEMFNNYYLQGKLKNEIENIELEDLKILLGNSKEGIGYLPLAIKILAVRGNKYKKTVSELKNQYNQKRLEILDLGDLTFDQNKNKEAIFCFELSYSDLSDYAKELFMRCGLFFYPFTKNRIKQIEDYKERDIDDDFDILINIRLIERENDLYTLHPLLREFALYKAEKAGLIDSYYEEQIHMFLRAQEEDFQENDYSQIQDLISYCKTKEKHNSIVEFSKKLSRNLHKKGFWERKIHLNIQAIESSEVENDNTAIARNLFELGDILSRQFKCIASNEKLNRTLSIVNSNETNKLNVNFINYLIFSNDFYLKNYEQSIKKNFEYIRKICIAREYPESSRFIKTISWNYNIYNHPNAIPSAISSFMNNKFGKSSNFLRSFSEDLIPIISQKNEVQKAILFFKNAKRLSIELQNSEDSYYIQKGLVELLLKTDDLNMIRREILEYKNITVNMGFVDHAKNIYKYQSVLAFKEGNYEESLHFIEKSTEEAKIEWKPRIVLHSNEIEQAEKEIEKSTAIFIKNEDLVRLANLYLDKAILELKRKDLKIIDAVEYYARSCNTLRWLNISESVAEKFVLNEILKIIDVQTFDALADLFVFKYVKFKKDESGNLTDSIPSFANFFFRNLPAIITDFKGKEMILIPEGKCFVGNEKIIEYDLEFILENMDDFWEGKYKNRNIATQLYLYPFYVDKSPVSNKEYKAFCIAENYLQPEHWSEIEDVKDDLPVTNISTDDAKSYIKWYNNLHPNKCQKSLPTEAEWEKIHTTRNSEIYRFAQDYEIGKDNPNFLLLLNATVKENESYQGIIEFLLGEALYNQIVATKRETTFEFESLFNVDHFISQENKSFLIDKLVDLPEEKRSNINYTSLLRFIAYSSTLETHKQKKKLIESLPSLKQDQIFELLKIFFVEILEYHYNNFDESHLIEQFNQSKHSWIKYLKLNFGIVQDAVVSNTLTKEFILESTAKSLVRRSEIERVVDSTAESDIGTGFRCIYPIFSNSDISNFLA